MTATAIPVPLPPGVTARRATAAGRKGATRWEISTAGRYLGDLVRWLPEGTWDWQPDGVYDAILAGTARPEEVAGGTLEACLTAVHRAAEGRLPAGTPVTVRCRGGLTAEAAVITWSDTIPAHDETNDRPVTGAYVVLAGLG